MAKFWATRMIEKGVDTEDETQLERFLVMAQTGEIDYDPGRVGRDHAARVVRRGIGAFEFEADGDRLLPPVSLPATEELTTLASAAPLVTHLRALVTRVGNGRTLTSTKRLRVADAKDLARAAWCG